MPIPNVAKLRKKDIVAAQKFKCKHGHTGLSHWECFMKAGGFNEKVGYFDIEATNLKADYGIMLSYCIKERGKKTIRESVVTKAELSTSLDREIIKRCIEDLAKFDRVVTYYGTGYDLPFVRTRAAVHGIPFPEYGQLLHTDLYYLVRNKFCMSSKRLENACRVILGKTQKTRLEQNHWIKGGMGDVKSLKYILKHCQYDVIDLELLHDAISGYRKVADTSI